MDPFGEAHIIVESVCQASSLAFGYLWLAVNLLAILYSIRHFKMSVAAHDLTRAMNTKSPKLSRSLWCVSKKNSVTMNVVQCAVVTEKYKYKDYDRLPSLIYASTSASFAYR